MGPGEISSIIASTAGGVMTKEAGAVTGDLEVVTRAGAGGSVGVMVRYAGAGEWYTVSGGPVGQIGSGGSSDPELNELHERVVEHLTTPGRLLDGNEEPSSLLSFPS